MSKSAKHERADKILVERGLAESRTRAQAMIMAGTVFIGEQRVEKPGDMISVDSQVKTREQEYPWVSRGGLKLDHGLNYFSIDPKNSICLDIGASTGGFTDVLIQRGAKKVYAVDVGRGQLDWKLRQNNRVTVLEGTNARHLTAEQIPNAVDLVVCDTSFIGLEKVLPNSLSLARPGAQLIALIKPQFQAGRKDVGKGGIVRDSTVHKRVCEEINDWLTVSGWYVCGIIKSPITGAKGNVEFLIAAKLRSV